LAALIGSDEALVEIGLKAKSEVSGVIVLSGDQSMVSADHFTYELRSQLRTAADQGATSIVITSRELCESVRMGSAWLNACCKAMELEVRPGDTVIHGKDVGVGMSIRYELPRL
jgi:hypothetical protein